MSEKFVPGENLYRHLFHAYCWFDDCVRNKVREIAGLEVNRTEAMLLLCVADGVTQSSELAAILGISRQAVHKAVAKLQDANVLTLKPHPENQRSKQVVFADTATPLHQTVTGEIKATSKRLRSRIGDEEYRQLVKHLSRDWGPTHD